ncbi:molybdenum cofactor biosynthesis protein B [Paenibacillus sp. YYML68]|uniref:MogA/MoaB family molybdenum cofactor biosynthesis protein n=1 Tax=Paenibacillus sp. YYML68 TaxID=2909250 RepID=UPI002492537A|nr:molybdenum cofactor biosynthesis protein B [Paenibacillus sp. YYML68]
MSSVEEHRRQAPASVRCMIITVSDTRTAETDVSGSLIMELLSQAGGFEVVDYRIVRDEYASIQRLIREAAGGDTVEAVLINGGTGIAKRDTTHEAVRDVLDKEMPGFGEIFRYLSFVEDIGAAAILSRAVAGVCNDTAIFSMPGSSGAVKLAMNRIVIPELKHVMREIYKDLT